ncbi:MAG: hypothetical protein DMG38_26500 [Acidobacteria bacterium]|nr:MAG: hypothetical protein DMG38_26500 [Acidobacteriota bacterium]
MRTLRASELSTLWLLAFPCPISLRNWPVTPRVSQTPLVDKGFASVRKIGNGLYATVSDPSKGPTTICNRGFLINS